MSETTTEYGTPKTVCDTEPFPPQTGDLLGSYIARLSARVRELETLLQERYNGHNALRDTVIRIANHVGYDLHPQRETSEPSAYRRSLEARIERLESLIERLMARMDVLDNIVEDYITFGCGHELRPQPEPTEEPAATTLTATRERTHGRYGTRNLTKSKPDHIVDANKKVCAMCGHAKDDHLTKIRDPNGVICWGGTLGKPCKCREFTPVASEG